MKIYQVGGCVRDRLLGLNPSDLDYVVVGSSPEEMLSLGYLQVGKSFPVFLHPQTKAEYALARRELKTGPGHAGFAYETKGVSLEEDLLRRDLTINSMAMDSQGNLIDPYGGLKDLQNKVARATSAAFLEDPLRVLRLARFVAKYDLQIEETTQVISRIKVFSEDFKTLSAERIRAEFEKAMNPEWLNAFAYQLHNLDVFNAWQIDKDQVRQTLYHLASTEASKLPKDLWSYLVDRIPELGAKLKLSNQEQWNLTLYQDTKVQELHKMIEVIKNRNIRREAKRIIEYAQNLGQSNFASVVGQTLLNCAQCFESQDFKNKIKTLVLRHGTDTASLIKDITAMDTEVRVKIFTQQCQDLFVQPLTV